MYDSSLKYKWDNKNVLDYALNEGREAGRQEGIKEGIKEGRQEGIKEGMERGKYEEAVAIAREMKKEGFPAVQIVKFTKLSIEEIEKL